MKEMTLNEAVAICHDYGQPLSISVNGNEKLYLMDEKTYNSYLETKEFIEIMKGIEDIENGKYVQGDKFFEEMNRKYGI